MNFLTRAVPPDEEHVESKMAEHKTFGNRLRKTLYYGEYSDASLPSMSVTDVAVEALNNAVSPKNRYLDKKFAHGVTRRAKISPCTLMMGMLYIERLRQQNRLSPSKELSSSDMFLISIMVASKYLYDEGEEEEVYNEDWAKAGLKSVHELNKLEVEFLGLMDWNLFITPNEFMNFVNKVESQIAASKGHSRGWLTYTDLETLLNNEKLQETMSVLTRDAMKVILSCIATYLLGLSLLLSTTAMALLQLSPPQALSMTPVAHPTANCLTSDASCLFTRHDVHVSPAEPGIHAPLAVRRRRTRIPSPTNGQDNLSMNASGTPKRNGKEKAHTWIESVALVQWIPPIAYYLERFQGTSVTLPAFLNFTVNFENLRPNKNKNRASAYPQNYKTWHVRKTKSDENGRNNSEPERLTRHNKTLYTVAPKCQRRPVVCIA